MRQDPYLTLGGRYDNARVEMAGGLALPTSSKPAPLNSPSGGNGQELVSWSGMDRGRAPRGRALRLWCTPPSVYDLTTALQVAGTINTLSMEFLATGTGSGGAATTRRFVVNGGQETVIEVGAWEAGKIEIVAASVAFNAAAPLGFADPINAGWANFAWLDSLDGISTGAREQLVSRVYRTNVDPINAATIVVPPGATRWRPYGTVHAALGGFGWPTAVAPTAASRAFGGFVTVAAFPVLPMGEWTDINGAKLITMLMPVGSPFTFVEHQFELGPL
jgi:hypothetical protein